MIKASNSVTDLTGIGEEWLVTDDAEYIRIRFLNGHIITTTSSLSNGTTDGPTLNIEQEAA